MSTKANQLKPQGPEGRCPRDTFPLNFTTQFRSLLFQKRRLSIVGVDGRKLCYYTSGDEKSRYLLGFARAVHQRSLGLAGGDASRLGGGESGDAVGVEGVLRRLGPPGDWPPAAGESGEQRQLRDDERHRQRPRRTPGWIAELRRGGDAGRLLRSYPGGADDARRGRGRQ